MGALATCQTNVACLLELLDAMQSGTNVDGANEKIQQITGFLIVTVRYLPTASVRSVSHAKQDID